MAEKRIYFFGDGKADGSAEMKRILGGKGAGLAEMSRLGIPVPPGFTISAEVCMAYLAEPEKTWAALEPQIHSAVAELERLRGRSFGSPDNPLLVSVRSGAAFSMPGMMDTILNLGLNENAVKGLAALTGNEAFALDCWRRLIEKYGEVVHGVPGEKFAAALEELKKKRGAAHDRELGAEDLRGLAAQYQAIYMEHTGRGFPQDVRLQLREAVDAVFRSWNNPRARTYRRLNNIPADIGTAVTVQSMVFGNLGATSATGVAFTRNPATGENVLYGEFLPNAQGEDVVAGIRTPFPLNRATGGKDADQSLESMMPRAYAALMDVRGRLEKRFRDMMDLEFTVEEGRLYMLQARAGKRTGEAALRIACGMAGEGLISESEAVMRVEPGHLEQLLAPSFEGKDYEAARREGRILARGLPAGPGAASGKIALSATKAVEMAKRGERVLLVRHETSPEDVAGMSAAAGILTARGGMTSHAAVVARGMGKPCVTGCGALDMDYGRGIVHAAGRSLREGDALSINGGSGEVILGALGTSPSEIARAAMDGAAGGGELAGLFFRFMGWVDASRRLGVRANADTPEDAALARRLGAAGIGLCRTEHMFFGEERIAAMREMILAATAEERRRALEKLLPFQRADFEGIFRAMQGLPVTVRLLDPPLHEFLPHDPAVTADLARRMGVPAAEVEAKARALREINPMLGHRGCRLALTYPEIYEMQARAIFEAAAAVSAEGMDVRPEVMIPIVSDRHELDFLRPRVESAAAEVEKKTGRPLNYSIGTMLEIPRACLRAEDIARAADFFSFGTNDLTQMCFGFSRDDAGSFLPFYVDEKILAHDPFQKLDQEGVGELMRLGVERGRAGNPSLKTGICGEHGGEPSSVRFCHQIGLDYVSCSPYRLPIARLAAAQAALEESGTAKGDTR